MRSSIPAMTLLPAPVPGKLRARAAPALGNATLDDLMNIEAAAEIDGNQWSITISGFKKGEDEPRTSSVEARDRHPQRICHVGKFSRAGADEVAPAGHFSGGVVDTYDVFRDLA